MSSNDPGSSQYGAPRDASASSSRSAATRRRPSLYEQGVVAIFVLFLIAMVLPWESVSASNGTITRSDSLNGFNLAMPRIAFLLLALGAAYIILRAFGVQFRRNVSRSFVALIDVGLAGALAVVGFFVAMSDVGDVPTDLLPGVSVDASVGTGAVIGLILGLAAVALAALILLAERKSQASQGVPPQFATGPSSYVQGQTPATTWDAPADPAAAPPSTALPTQPPPAPLTPESTDQPHTGSAQ